MRVGIGFLVSRSLRRHKVSTGVAMAAIALAAGLTMAVFSIQAQAMRAFTSGAGTFDAVLGARGSKLQLVLNSIFQLETSAGNLPWGVYESIKNDPRVEVAIPYAVGDNYQGYRIVGTTAEIFETFEPAEGEKLTLLPGGRPFDPGRREAVIGETVARRAGLSLGMEFEPYHGLHFDEGQRHAEDYVVVGIFEATNTPVDRVIWIPIEGVFRMTGHVLRGTGETYVPDPTEPIPDEHKEVSSVLLKFTSTSYGFALDQAINREGRTATLAWPIGAVMADLFEKIGWAHVILQAVAYLVLLVALASVLAILYGSLSQRRRDFAILRALGAHRRTVFSVLVLESTVIAAVGSVLGYAVYFAITIVSANVLHDQVGVLLQVFRYHPALAFVPLGCTVLGALAGLLPGYEAYRTDVAGNLTPVS